MKKMKRKLGIILMVMGASLILAAMSLFLYNQYESRQAENSAEAVMEQLVEKVTEETPEAPAAEEPTEDPIFGMIGELADPTDVEMTEVEIDGHSYI